MIITSSDLEIQREPFARPFGFKGSAFHEKWNCVVRLRSENGHEAIGIGGLAVLWSDPDVFTTHTEVGGNLLQSAVLEHALQHVTGHDYADPPSILGDVLPIAHEYGCRITGRNTLRLTFVLTALVALDNSAWLLYAKENGITRFDDLIPNWAAPNLSHHQDHLVIAPAVNYNLPMDELDALIEAGAHVLKIKIGHPGDEQQMLEKDKAWLSQIHSLAKDCRTDRTESGRVLYHLDANGRYREKASIAGLLAHAETIDALDRIILIEEPFSDSVDVNVADLPALCAADESVHTVEDIGFRAKQGYGAVAIKPAGKTLSLAFEMVRAASDAGLECLVADNGCVPTLVEWNKNIAARLPRFPGLYGGLMESNGPETYGAWNRLLADYPVDGTWLRPANGAFTLDATYYDQSGGIFETPETYADLFRSP